ncbi:MAG: DUF6216 family protein [Pantoea vagans]|nr:DUF6216 family protein [Pantoea vagans]
MENYSSIFSLLPAPFSFIAAIVILLLIIQYVRRKTNSSYSLLDKLWGWVVGNNGFRNPQILDFHEEMQDIDRFNLIYNMKAKSINEIINMQRWLKEESYDIRELSRLSSFFDIVNLKIRKPNKLVSFSLFLSIIMILPLGLVCFVPLISFGAIIQASDSKTLMIISSDKAIVFGEHFSLHKDDCDFKKIDKNRLSDLSRFSPNDIDDLCEAFKDEAFKRVIFSLNRMESMFSVFGFLVIYFSIVFFLELNRRIYTSTFISRHRISHD